MLSKKCPLHRLLKNAPMVSAGSTRSALRTPARPYLGRPAFNQPFNGRSGIKFSAFTQPANNDIALGSCG
jgi:hypothetical protein